MQRTVTLFALVTLCWLAGCNEEPAPPEVVRAVRTITVEHSDVGETVALSGHIEPREATRVGFRLGGKLVERLVSVDDTVASDQVLARLDRADVESMLRSAEAELAAATAMLEQTAADEERQKILFQRGVVAQARYDQAEQQLRSARSQVEAAEARVTAVNDQLNYTELRSDSAGTVTAVGAEPGEVVSSGQMIVTIAREGERDAVFHVPASLIRRSPPDPRVEITLADETSVTTIGRVREVAPQADPATRTFEVKVTLDDAPAEMRLGATVIGTIHLESQPAIILPASAMMESDGKPAVWIVSNGAVALREVQVLRYDTDTVIISEGLEDGEVIVTAGVQALRPGQKVKLLGAAS